MKLSAVRAFGMVATAWVSMVLGSSGAAAQPGSPTGCTLEKNHLYRCSAEPFRSLLAGAHVVAVDADPMDRYTQRELRHLIERLGKRLAQPGESPDLTFVVIPADPSAISIGPADRPLASLQVYARSGQQGRGTLVWNEIVVGQGDRPWPTIVRSVIDQFESHAQSESRARDASQAAAPAGATPR